MLFGFGFWDMPRLIVLIIAAAALGACSTTPAPQAPALALNQPAAASEAEARSEDPNRLIQMLNAIKLTHFRDAVREIEQR
jgi:uncharacterized lipoprotein YmbA